MTTQTEGRTLKQVVERMEELRKGVLSLGPADEGFNTAVVEYSGLLEEHRNLTVQANESAISDGKARLAEGIQTLVDSLGLADLKQEPITYVTWKVVTGEDDSSHVEVGLNPTVTAPKRRAPRKSGGGDGVKGEGRDLETIFETHATPDEKAKMENVKNGYTSSGKDYVDPDSDEGKKKANSRSWALKNQVANRVEGSASSTQ